MGLHKIGEDVKSLSHSLHFGGGPTRKRAGIGTHAKFQPLSSVIRNILLQFTEHQTPPSCGTTSTILSIIVLVVKRLGPVLSESQSLE